MEKTAVCALLSLFDAYVISCRFLLWIPLAHYDFIRNCFAHTEKNRDMRARAAPSKSKFGAWWTLLLPSRAERHPTKQERTGNALRNSAKLSEIAAVGICSNLNPQMAAAVCPRTEAFASFMIGFASNRESRLAFPP